MAQYSIARGTSWQIQPTIRSGNVPINISTHHIMCTVRMALVDGTSDMSIPPVWQGDNAMLGGIVLSTQSGVTLGQCIITMPPSATQALANPIYTQIVLRYDITDNDGNGGIWETESGTIALTPRTGLTQP